MNNAKCIFLNTYYQAFLRDFYSQRPSLADAPFNAQTTALEESRFGESDFYSNGLRKAGWLAENIVVNSEPSQRAWAVEHNFSGRGLQIAVEQVRLTRPSVVYIHDIAIASEAFINAIRPHTELIVGQIACPLSANTFFPGFDLLFTSFPHFASAFQKRGLTAYYVPLAFEPSILGQMATVSRRIPVSFIGGISEAHSNGRLILEEIFQRVPFEIWGYGVETLPDNCRLKDSHHGPVWGLEMFSRLRDSRITINRHIDVAGDFANNMRLFEATGCGSLLLTDYKENLNELFEIGKEVVAFRSAEEGAALIRYYLSHDDEAGAIARAGQERTLRDHTYVKRMETVAEILSHHLRYKRERTRYGPVDLSKISCGYTAISSDSVSDELTSAWKSREIPERQRALVQDELEQMFKGHPPAVYRVLAETLRPITRSGSSILEIGCSSGYYYEVIEYLLRRRIRYTGVDYSGAMIAMAKEYYSRPNFHVADGANLPFADSEFEIAISSCVLLHVPNYQKHVAETARVSSRYVLAHRTPICRTRPTQYMTKSAYGVQVVELRYNEKAILTEFANYGLRLIQALEYYSDPANDQYEATYVFEKAKTNDQHAVAAANQTERG